jgi:hypothetical protein
VPGGGYGKTTALRLLAAGRPARWLALAAAYREVARIAAQIAGIGTYVQ